MNDLALLRQYEPVVCFTRGEMFFPAAVDAYVRRCSLLLRTGDRAAPPLVPAGMLDVDALAGEGAADPSRSLCLRFVQEPLRGAAYRSWLARPDRPEFQASGRLARVGLAARFVDALFTLSFLARGSVPGGTAAAAEQQYRAIRATSPEYVYYGRVVRRGGYIVLHYLFFYVMNDWRSSFAGVNDHEADWEQVFVYLTERADGPPAPAWIAYASHDYRGDDLRRRWDDPDITVEGTHPVVFTGAGSHASYFKRGEYLTSVQIRYLDPVLRAVHVLRRIWRDVLRQGESTLASRVEGLLRIAFVDYARGDGLAIGPGKAVEWSPVLIDDDTGWVAEYRGLWGLDTRDPLSGELAPSGPKYQRDGSVRQSWYDPLGWAGLEKVAPEPAALQVLTDQITALEKELAETDARIAVLADDLPRHDLAARALQGVWHLRRQHQARRNELAALEAEWNTLQARRVELTDTLAACRRYRERLEAGDPGDPHGHLRHTHEPQPPDDLRRSRFAETWAGLSIGVLLLGAVLVMFYDAGHWLIAIAILVGAVVLVENILRRTVTKLMLNATIVLALASAGVLIYEFFWELSLIAITVLAGIILRDNIRKVRRR